MSNSAHPAHEAVPGQNPNYYDETETNISELAGDVPQPGPGAHHHPNPLQSNPANAPPPPRPQEGQNHQYYPPPPPGPPPSSAAHAHHGTPPPPPGPPPSSAHNHNPVSPTGAPLGPTFSHERLDYVHPPSGAPPGQADGADEVPDFAPPPYEEPTAAGAHAGYGHRVDEKPHAPPQTGDLHAGGAQTEYGYPADEKPPVLPQDGSGGAQSSSAHAGYGHAADNKPPGLPPRPVGTASGAAATVPHDAPAAGGSKHGFGSRLAGWATKASGPINKLTNKLGSEAFWPTTLDKECDKAARILHSFCTGFYTTPSNAPAQTGETAPQHSASKPPQHQQQQQGNKVIVKIPPAAIANAKGLAIFTTLRAGFQISGACGSGLVMARLPDGSWSPPSGFIATTAGAGLMAGLDIYDCVCVLNTAEAVHAFTRPRLSLGGEVGVAAGPVGGGASLEAARGGGKPVWSYMKSRGLYVGAQVDGTVIVERPDANAAFYGQKGLTVERILKGDIGPGGGSSGSTHGTAKDGSLMYPAGAAKLTEVLKLAEGRGGADERVLREVQSGPTPGDLAGAGAPEEAVDGKEKDGIVYR